MSSSTAETKKVKSGDANEIVKHFNMLRQDQQQFAKKLSELEIDLNEYKVVIETLQKVDPERKCFRMIGGILTERNVKDVLPALQEHNEKLKDLITRMNETLIKKGEEINKFKDKHQIKLLTRSEAEAASQANKEEKSSHQNVLVS